MTLEYCETKEDVLRCSRRFLANVRVIMVEKARWCSLATYKETKENILDILADATLKKSFMITQLKNYHLCNIYIF